VQSKAELYERILNHLQLRVGEGDIVTMQLFHMMQEKKEWHASRKVSIGFVLRSKVVAERKILYNQENLAASHARREETNQIETYTKLVNKVMPLVPLTGFAAYKSQARSQATLAEEFRKGFKSVSFCKNCNMYSRDNSKKPHKCKKSETGGGATRSQPKLYAKWKSDPTSVNECVTCGIYYLKAHKKCASAKSKARLSQAQKRMIDEKNVGGTQSQEEPQKASTARERKKAPQSKRNESDGEQEEKEEDFDEKDDEEGDEEQVRLNYDSDSSGSYTPARSVAPIDKLASLPFLGKRNASYDVEDEIAEQIGRAEADEAARVADAERWEANLPPREDHPDAHPEMMYNDQDLHDLKFEKEVARRGPFNNRTEQDRLARDPMAEEDWISIRGNNEWIRSGIVERVVSHINSTSKDESVFVTNVALEHSLFPEKLSKGQLLAFLKQNDPAKCGTIWREVS
jgi:hypothetical protein